MRRDAYAAIVRQDAAQASRAQAFIHLADLSGIRRIFRKFQRILCRCTSGEASR
jgi:hypothetical protein